MKALRYEILQSLISMRNSIPVTYAFKHINVYEINLRNVNTLYV